MRTLDYTDLKCPLPLLKLKVAINDDSPEHVIRLVTTDPISLHDIRAYCQRAGHRLTSVKEGRPHEFIIELKDR